MTLSADRIDLRMTIARRYRVVNGDHPMSPVDDAYVDRQYAPLDQLVADPDEAREHVIAGRLPLPSYLRSDGTEMYHRDLFDLVERAGGVEFYQEWFVRQFRDPAVGREEWRTYLTGQYVCLRSVTPRTIQRKDELVTAIRLAVADPQPWSAGWLDQLHDWVDELDALSPAYTGYDVLRFGGPTGRQTNIDAVRQRFPRRRR
jgi:hypothetical protein